MKGGIQIDCHQCLLVGDPYCGWCMKTSTCSTQEVCDADALNPNADWLNYKSGRCPFIRRVEPQEQQITSSARLAVQIENAPSTMAAAAVEGSGERLSCLFHFPNQKISVEAKPTENGCANGAISK